MPVQKEPHCCIWRTSGTARLPAELPHEEGGEDCGLPGKYQLLEQGRPCGSVYTCRIASL